MALNQILQVTKLKHQCASCPGEGELVFWSIQGMLLITMTRKKAFVG